MKILHAAETIKGGIASYLEEVLPYQINEFGQGNVIALVPDLQSDCLPNLKGNLVTFQRKYRSFAGLWNFIIKLIGTLKKQKPDIVFLHSTFAGFLGRLVILFYRQKIRVIYCPHGWSFAMKTSKLKKCIYCFIERMLGNYATDKIICISRHEYKLAINAGIKENKLTLIYNGIAQPSGFAYVKDANNNRPLEMLFVGRFDRAKGLDILLEAIKNIDKGLYNLTVIGGFVDGHALPAMPQNVNFLGWLERQKVLGQIFKADVLVMPSRWEGFSILALEAMACATAIFAANEASLPEQIEAGVTGELFEISNIGQLQELIINASIARLHKMGRLGREKYLDKFTAKIMNDKIISLVRS